MTFDLNTILIFIIGAVIYSAILPKQLRQWAIFIASVVVIYWLQPAIFVRRLDFIFPTATLLLTVGLWWFTRKSDDETQGITRHEDLLSLGIILAIIIGMSLMRGLPADQRLTPSRPPEALHVILTLTGILLTVFGISALTRPLGQRRIINGWILVIVGVFIVFKTEALGVELSRFVRSQTGQNESLASLIDLNWLGFSYIAFRLIHTLRDRQSGKLPTLSLRGYVTYVIFFPSIVAGPIDRAERFKDDFDALPDMQGLDASRYTEGFTRIAVGIFKKFIIADTLAIGMALNVTNADQATSTIGLWILLYGYAFRLFFDFSGYSDIAIGIGILLGIKLPENFDRPYLKSNITTFWQSWHITLSNWARFYVFSPLSRFLLTRKPKPSTIIVILSTQMATMIVIGLWHGVTVNFLLWGVWHGLGLFVHKQWSDRTRKWYRGLKETPRLKQAWTLTGWFITFQFVVLGWVWFALPNFDQSIDIFSKLLGVN